jgi:hypothetical protein
MDNILLNVGQISSIKKVLFRCNTRFSYKKGFKFLFLKIREEGFYHTYGYDTTGPHSKEEIEKENNCLVVGEFVIWKPYLIITLNNGNVYKKHFDSVELLEEYLNKPELSGLKLIEVND